MADVDRLTDCGGIDNDRWTKLKKIKSGRNHRQNNENKRLRFKQCDMSRFL